MPSTQQIDTDLPVLTPYAATELVNKELKRAGVRNPRTGLPKRISSAMLYIYAEKGRFTREKAPDGRWSVNRVSFQEWVAGYVRRALERQTLKEELEDGVEEADA
jgi:hypothetical protein